MDTKQIIDALMNDLKEEIEHICGITIGSTTILSNNWIPGTELTIGVPTSVWKRVRSGISERVSFSDMIHLYWSETRGQWPVETDIYLRIGRAVWQSTRDDRFRGSRILSILNNDPIGSSNRLQTVKLVRGSGTGVLQYEGGDIDGRHRLFHLIAHFLEISLRLSPRDIGNFIGRVSRQHLLPFDATHIVAEGTTEEEHLMLQAARRALVHAQVKGYWTQQLYKIRFPLSLKELSEGFRISAADRSFDNGCAVMVILSGTKAKEALCQLQPSFFIFPPATLNCRPQVHIIDTPVCGCALPLLLGFTRKPQEVTIEHAIKCVYRVLGLPSPNTGWIIDSTSCIATEPFTKQDGVAWFRADGVLEMNFKDRVLSRYLRRAMAKLRSTHFDKKRIRDSNLFVGKSVRWVLWVRQSNEDGKRARDTIPRQLTTLLVSTILGDEFSEGDEVVICCELCSSSKHPLRDRRLWNAVRGMTGMPIRLLTVNPDRMTRRADEVDAIRTHIASTGGMW